jgi:hypothetical protein
MSEKTIKDMAPFGIVVDDLRFVEQIFKENGWDIDKIVFRWNIKLERLEAYEVKDLGILRVAYLKSGWWELV